MSQEQAKTGISDQLKREFDEIALWVGLLFIALLIAVSVYNVRSGQEQGRWVAHTYEVIRVTDALSSAMKDAETGQRGFLLTGVNTYLEPYEKAEAAVTVSHNKLKALTADNAAQQERLAAIDTRIKAKFAELDETIRLRKKSGFEAALEVVKTGKGKKVMDELRQLLKQFKLQEEELLQQRTAESTASANLSLWVQGIGGVLVVVYLSFALLSIRKQKKTRRQLFTDLDDNNRKYLLNNGDVLHNEQAVIGSLVNNLQSTKEFIRQIGNKQFDVQLQGLAQEHYALNRDNMAGALLEVRDLLKANEKEDNIRQWTNEGLARFSDLIRKSNHSLDVLANESLQNLIKYLKVNQGILYIVNADAAADPYMEAAACYAWNKKKFIKKRIEKGDGLAGQAWQEADTLFLTDIPKDYVKITSGLGAANPNCILIVPLKANDEVLGILEIASFQKLEGYEVKFVEKIAETLASALNGARINERTKKLLEGSQQQAEELRAQEEEMRQNMEELEATQEEMRRTEIETRGQLTAINNTLATIEFDMRGNIQKANEKFLNTMGYTLGEVKGKHHRMFCEMTYVNSDDYAEFWSSLNAGNAQNGEFIRKAKGGKDVWIRASYTPVFDSKGNPYKIIKFAFDITREKLKVERSLLQLQEN